MKTAEIAELFLELYPKVYLQFYRRRDPKAYRPSTQTLAVMEHLAATGPLTVSEAARHFDRSQAATSEIIERMLSRGLLLRIQDEADRRRHLVWLSEKGRAVLDDERLILSPELIFGAIGKMKKTDRDALIRGIRALLEAGVAAAHNKKEKHHA